LFGIYGKYETCEKYLKVMVIHCVMNRDERRNLKKYIVDACVKMANKKGWCDAVGVLRGTLFLAEEPMSMDQLVEDTGYSKSTVSTNMNLLEDMGFVKRVVTPGDKRYHYVPVTDPDSLREAMLVNVRNEIQLVMTALDNTERDIRNSGVISESILDKVANIRHFYQQTNKLLDIMSKYTTDELIDLLEKRCK
jgi:DNA-binding transcriptional regulator GbsR (MarR family)